MTSKLTPSQIASFPESKQHSIVGSLVLFLILGNLSVLFRLVSQLRVYKQLFVEDYCIIFAVVIYLPPASLGPVEKKLIPRKGLLEYRNRLLPGWYVKNSLRQPALWGGARTDSCLCMSR